jgi:hypothetical protein
MEASLPVKTIRAFPNDNAGCTVCILVYPWFSVLLPVLVMAL